MTSQGETLINLSYLSYLLSHINTIFEYCLALVSLDNIEVCV